MDDLFGIVKSDDKDSIYDVALPMDWNFVDIKDDYEAFWWFMGLVGREVHGDPEIDRVVDFYPPRLSIEVASKKDHNVLADNLLSEAVATRNGVIPPAAFVEVGVKPFIGVHVQEVRDRVYFAWETGNSRYFCCWVEVSDDVFTWKILSNNLAALRERILKNGKRTVDDDGVGFNISQQELNAMRELEGSSDDQLGALYFLSAAILRDFWVVEQKDSVFMLGRPRRRRVFGLDRAAVRVIYLPRIKYNKVKVEQYSGASVHKWEVSKHFVRSHTRNLHEGHVASIKQKVIASLHGVSVKDGTTWIKGYFAGNDAEVSKVYKSRTATKTLVDVMELTRDNNALRGLSWFQFERLCENALRDHGYNIVDKVGDDGIDILCAKKDGSFALAQAKHWERPIGPGPVRELDGSRNRFIKVNPEAGASGVVAILMSSSGFSDKARTDAELLDIQLVDVRTK